MKSFKFLLGIIAAAALLSACDSKSDPVATQIFTVLNATTGKSAKGATDPQTLAASTTYKELGAVKIFAQGYDAGGSLVNKEIIFDYSDVGQATGTKLNFSKTETTSGGSDATAFEATAATTMVLGGAKKGLKYGDFGYWQQTFTKKTGDVEEKAFASDAMMFFEPDYRAKDITVAANNTGKYAYTGNVLGSVDLYKHDGANKSIEEMGELTGSVTLNADFKNKTFKADMGLYINGSKWYNLAQEGSIVNTDGSFAAVNDTAIISGTPSSNLSKYTMDDTVNKNSSMQGQFLGPDSNTIPQEGVGVFDVEFKNANSNDYSAHAHGAFGVKR